MAVIPKDVLLTGAVVDGRVTGQAGGAGVGFRVESATNFGYPPGQWPVTVRAYNDATTYVDHLIERAQGARYLNEGFQKLELLGPQNTMWKVTVYETQDDRDEPAPFSVLTFRDQTAGFGGDVLKVVPVLQPMNEQNAQMVGTRALQCNAVGAPYLAEGSTGYARPLKLDSDGRLRVSDESGLTLLQTNTTTKATAPAAFELLNAAAQDVSAYSLLVLRTGLISAASSGTSPTVVPVIRSVASATLAGGAQADELELHSFLGGNAAVGQASEVIVGEQSQATGTLTRTRVYGGRCVRIQIGANFSGSPTAFSVKWELWGAK